jgi:4-amino-4-deoxy-L-arabinose transferase-like glycosyltransferase
MGDPTPIPVRPRRATLARFASLALILELALGLRVIAADLVQIYVDHRAARAADPADRPICIFPDTRFYWDLARTIREGTPYEVMYYSDIPHFSLRTPGYPLFLAGCQAMFGERALPVRLVQAILGTLSVWLVFQLTREVAKPPPERSGWTVPLAAALIAAVEPYTVFLSPLILSEAVFVPLMLASLWGMAAIWRGDDAVSGRRTLFIALGIGASLAAAVLVRPSWALFVPLMLGVWIASGLSTVKLGQAGELARRLRVGGVVILGFMVVMSPWWVRNYGIYGRFVPTALWTGASLYDGLNPRATGGSDMAFLGDPDIWPLGEEDQDDELTRRALAFARAEPGRAAWLAVAKFGRYWRPWPDAEGFRSIGLAAVSAAVTLPLFALIALGLWSSRRDPRVWVLLAGPALYFCVLHLVFASSMRYRIPGEVPALGLAALGLGRVARRVGEAGV